jgi:hypothetical protein
MANAASLDVSFDVPVKLYSSSLVAMASLLLVPEVKSMKRVFLLANPSP